MQIIFKIIPIGFVENEVKILFEHHDQQFKLIQVDGQTNLDQTIQIPFQKKFQIKIDPDQITFLAPHQINHDQPIVIGTIVQLRIDQLPTIQDQLTHEKTFQFEDINTLIQIDPDDRTLIQNARQNLNQQYQIHRLTAFHVMLPKEFTAYYLSSFISKLIDHHIKPNNLKYYFRNQIKFLRKDHSKRGYPKSIFTYQTKK